MTLIDQTGTSAPLQALLDGRLLDFPTTCSISCRSVSMSVMGRASWFATIAPRLSYGVAPQRWAIRQFVTVALIAFTIWTGAMCPMRNVPWPTSSQPARDCATRRS